MWIARRLQPEQLRAIERLELRVLRRRREPNLHAHLRKISVGDQARRVVAVRWQHDNITWTQQYAKECGGRRHSRGKDDRWATFEFGERILKIRPGWIVEAAISVGRQRRI